MVGDQSLLLPTDEHKRIAMALSICSHLTNEIDDFPGASQGTDTQMMTMNDDCEKSDSYIVFGYGADIDARDENGNTAFAFSSRDCRGFQVVKKLERYCQLEIWKAFLFSS